jgi:hypothetical protein
MQKEDDTALQLKLQKLADFCTHVTQNLKSDSNASSKSFEYSKFIDDLIAKTKLLDESVTKFAVLCKAPPKIPESLSLTDSLHNQAKALCSLIQSVNEATAGHYFWLKVKEASEGVFASLGAVAESFLGEALHERQPQVISTRKIWDSCKILQAIPKNDAFAVVLVLQNSLELIDDAILEVGTANEWDEDEEQPKESDNNASLASDKDDEIMRLTRELIQGCYAFLKKSLIYSIEREDSTPETVRWLDLYCREALKLEVLTDIVCTALFHPMDKDAICDGCRQMVQAIENLMNILKQELPDQNTCWMTKYPAFFSTKLGAISERHPER